MPKIWIDTDSGTYGVDSNSIVFLDLGDDEADQFDLLSDNERIQIADLMDAEKKSFKQALEEAGIEFL